MNTFPNQPGTTSLSYNTIPYYVYTTNGNSYAIAQPSMYPYVYINQNNLATATQIGNFPYFGNVVNNMGIKGATDDPNENKFGYTTSQLGNQNRLVSSPSISNDNYALNNEYRHQMNSSLPLSNKFNYNIQNRTSYRHTPTPESFSPDDQSFTSNYNSQNNRMEHYENISSPPKYTHPESSTFNKQYIKTDSYNQSQDSSDYDNDNDNDNNNEDGNNQIYDNNNNQKYDNKNQKYYNKNQIYNSNQKYENSNQKYSNQDYKNQKYENKNQNYNNQNYENKNQDYTSQQFDNKNQKDYIDPNATTSDENLMDDNDDENIHGTTDNTSNYKEEQQISEPIKYSNSYNIQNSSSSSSPLNNNLNSTYTTRSITSPPPPPASSSSATTYIYSPSYKISPTLLSPSSSSSISHGSTFINYPSLVSPSITHTSGLYSRDIYKKIGEGIVLYNEWCKYINEQKMQRFLYILQNIEGIVTAEFPDAYPELYGSSRTGLNLPSSDFDIYLHTSPSLSFFNTIYEMLLKQPWVKSCQYIKNTAVPVIKLHVSLFEETQRVSSLESTTTCLFPNCEYIPADNQDIVIDVSSNVHRGVIMSKLVSTLLDTFWELTPIIVILKQIVYECGLNISYQGGINSSAIFVLVNCCLNSMYMDPDKYQQSHSLNETERFIRLGTLFEKILFFLGNQFDPSEHGASLQNGFFYISPDVKSSLNSHGYSNPLYIIDPLDPTNNLGKNCFRIANVKQSFKLASDRLIQSRKNDKPTSLSLLASLIQLPKEFMNFIKINRNIQSDLV
ncbi:hypothetical protein WA158_000111 [Blastocystis sp. Blastoise]